MLAAALAVAPAGARAASISWNGSRSGDWFDARNWTPAAVPGAGDAAIVASGRAITLSGRDTSVGSLVLAGTSINNGTLRSLGGTAWTGGVVACNLIASVRLEISGSADKGISDSDSVVNEGLAVWSTPADGSGRILMGGSSRFVNSVGATFAANSDGTVFIVTPGKSGGLIENAGDFVKNNGSGLTRAVASPLLTLNQTGSLRADSGAMSVDGVLNLSQPNLIGGNGLVQLLGTISLKRLTTIRSTVEMSGTLTGDSLGSLAGEGGGVLPVLRWNGGALAGTVNVSPSLLVEVSGAASKYLNADCTLNNGGAFFWSAPNEGAGRILLRRRARFNNGAGASFNVDSDGTIFGYDDSSGDSLRAVFTNAGLFAKRGGAGASTFSSSPNADFVNSGTIEPRGATLAFNTRLDLNANGRLNGPGLVRMNSGTANLNALTSLGCAFELAGGTLNGVDAGSLGNAGGLLRWTNGTIAGTLNVGSGLPFEISGAADKSLAGGAAINNAGAATWSTPADNAGRILMARNSAFNTLSGGSFTAASGGSVFRFSEDALTAESFAANVSNAGQWSLAPGAPGGASRRVEGNIGFSNAGALNIGSGLLSVPRFVNAASGAVNIGIGGDGAGGASGALVVGGRASLAGVLNITPAANYSPPSGSVSNVVSYGVRTGTFSAINGLSLGGGRSLAASYEANALQLTARAVPIVTSISPTRGFVGDSVTISGLNLGDVSVTFAGKGSGVPAILAARTGTSVTVTVPAGARSGAVSVQNASGTAGVAFAVLPRIVGLSARSGLPGSRVVITGSGFNGGSSPIVRFGSAAASVASISAAGDRLEVIVPASAASGLVTVATGVGTATSPYAFTILPQIVSFSPASAAPGAVVSISGRGLVGVTRVYFGVTPALFSVVSPTLVRAFVPNGARSGPITIQASAGAARSEKAFLLAPRLLAFAPLAGVAGGVINISGAGLSEVTQVKIGATAVAFSRVSDTALRATVPAGGASGRLSVTSAGGTAVSAETFTLLPSITSFSPASGPVGTVVTIQGSGLADVRTATVNGKAAMFTRLSGNALSITIPVGATSGRITLTTAAGAATSAGSFTVTSAPVA